MSYSAPNIAHHRGAMFRQDQFVDPEEAQEIVRLAAQHQNSGMHDGPTVEGLAAALNLPPSEVQRLLDQVRQRNAQAGYRPGFWRSYGNGSGTALSAGLAVAFILTIVMIGLGGYFALSRQPTTYQVMPAQAAAPVFVEPHVMIAPVAPQPPIMITPSPRSAPEITIDASGDSVGTEVSPELKATIEQQQKEADERAKEVTKSLPPPATAR